MKMLAYLGCGAISSVCVYLPIAYPIPNTGITPATFLFGVMGVMFATVGIIREMIRG